jgi:hypothetical protein
MKFCSLENIIVLVIDGSSVCGWYFILDVVVKISLMRRF